MSKTLRFGTKITDANHLKTACDALREQGREVEGPTQVTNYDYYSIDEGKTIKVDGHRVRLEKWTSDCIFVCDPAGTMYADNYSPYYDDRRIDAATGQRVPGTGRVHPAVEAGEKLVGDDGKWGDISQLHDLQGQYLIAACSEQAKQAGMTLSGMTEEGDTITLEYDMLTS